MRRMVAIAVVLALMSNCTYSLRHYRVYARGDIIELNETIGDVIDAQERAEYDLFPDMGGFKEARFYAIPDGGYEVVVVTDHGNYVAVNRDLYAQQILRDYFSRYNTAQYSRRNFENRWKILGYDVLGFPITGAEVSRNTRLWCLIGGGLGCGLVSFGLSFGMASLIAFSELSSQHAGENDELYIGAIIGGTIVGMFTGAIIGGRLDSQRSMNAIRKARKPRVVE